MLYCCSARNQGSERYGSARGCLKQAREFAITMVVAMGIYIPSFSAGIYFHQNVPQWEPVAIFSSLVPGVVLSFLFFRRLLYRQRGFLRWVLGWVGGVFLGFSFTLALFHGWEAQAEAVIAVGIILFIVGVFVSLFRTGWHFHKAMNSISVAMNDPATGTVVPSFAMTASAW